MKNLITLSLLICSNTVFSAPTDDSSKYFYQKGLEEKVAKRYMVASKFFDKAIELNPQFIAAYIENGYVNLEMRKTNVAKQCFTKVYELEPANISATKELINLFYSYRQYQNAINLAKKVKANADINKIVAMSYYKLEDYGNAEKMLLAFLANQPNDAEATYTLGKTYLEMQIEAKAISYYQKAVELDPTKSKWLFELGLLFYSSNNYKNAVVYFTKAAEKGFTQSNDFNENLGFSYIYSGEFEKGEKLLLGLIAKNPGNKDILRDAAQAYFDHKKYDKSLEFCQKLMEMDMNDGKALYQAGLCFQRKGEKEKGQKMCDRAIELDPSLNNLRQKQMIAGL